MRECVRCGLTIQLTDRRPSEVLELSADVLGGGSVQRLGLKGFLYRILTQRTQVLRNADSEKS